MSDAAEDRQHGEEHSRTRGGEDAVAAPKEQVQEDPLKPGLYMPEPRSSPSSCVLAPSPNIIVASEAQSPLSVPFVFQTAADDGQGRDSAGANPGTTRGTACEAAAALYLSM